MRKPTPTADVQGHDAAAKAAILAGLAFHTEVTSADVYTEGIAQITAADIASAKTLGFVINYCSRSASAATGGISVRVHPPCCPRVHPLAAVHEAYNAVFVEAQAAGRLMFYGAGAGGQPTASAVLSATSSRLPETCAPECAVLSRRPTPNFLSCPWRRR